MERGQVLRCLGNESQDPGPAGCGEVGEEGVCWGAGVGALMDAQMIGRAEMGPCGDQDGV